MKLGLKKISFHLSTPLLKGHPRHAYGLAISDTSLELVNMLQKRDKVAIDAFSRVILEPGIVVRGYIRKHDAFAAALRELRQKKQEEHEPLTVVSAIPDYQVFTRLLSFDAASYDKDTIDEEIKQEMSKSLPLDFTEVVIRTITYSPSPEKKEVMAFATHRTLVENWISNMKKCGITLAVLEMTSLSLIRSLMQECPVGVSFFLLDIGASSTDLAIFDCHGIKLSASMPTGGRHFTEIIAQNLHIPTAEAEQQKCTIGLKGTGHSPVTPILEKELETIAQKVQKEIEFFEKGGTKVAKLFIVGGSSAMPGIIPFFQTKCGRETEQGHPWIDVKSGVVTSFALSSKKLPENQEHFYTGATGLALRGLNRGKLKEGINFLG